MQSRCGIHVGILPKRSRRNATSWFPRVVLRTDLLSRLAYVPEPTKAGDELVIFYGHTAPLVIRPFGTGRYNAMSNSLPSATYVLV